jgi:hypothetical protein
MEREEPGVWRIVCDSCGEALTLDTDGDDPREDAEQEAAGRDWVARPPETAKFTTDFGARKFTVEYREHDCPDCA